LDYRTGCGGSNFSGSRAIYGWGTTYVNYVSLDLRKADSAFTAIAYVTRIQVVYLDEPPAATATPVLTSTPVPTGTLVPEVIDCSVPEYAPFVPAMSWNPPVSGGGECVILIAVTEFDLAGNTYGFPGINLCYTLYSVPALVLFGFVLPVSLIVLPPAVWLILRIMQL